MPSTRMVTLVTGKVQKANTTESRIGMRKTIRMVRARYKSVRSAEITVSSVRIPSFPTDIRT